jgi:hypothetical protein
MVAVMFTSQEKFCVQVAYARTISFRAQPGNPDGLSPKVTAD